MDLLRSLTQRAPQPVVQTTRRLAERIGLAGARKSPLLSIVLPVYNVEQYLAECLDSILGQNMRSFEVVVVDDGSPDGSTAIALGYAERDSRIRVVHQANAGLGAARNTGLRQATGRYLMFVDSDDRLPPGALSALVRSCERTGSDIAVGSIVRFDSRRVWAPEWVADIHAIDRRGVTLQDFPALLRNNYSWCKVFRRSFWERCDLWFREGVAYEDQPIITQLYARASGIDVLTTPVYEYRAREDASSISQQTGTVKDLADRVGAWFVSRDALRAEAPGGIYQAWLQTLFSVHFHWYLNNRSAETDDEYWALLRKSITELSDGASDAVWRATPPHRRVMIELTRRDLRAELVEFRRQRGDRTENFPTTVRDDGILLHLPMQGPHGPSLDDELFVLRPEQLVVRHEVRRLSWVRHQGEGAPLLRVSGYAYLPHLDLRVHPTEVILHLRHAGSGAPISAVASLVADAALRPSSTAEHADYSSSAFAVELPTDGIAAVGPGKSWVVEVEVRTARISRRTAVVEVSRSGSAALLETDVDPSGRRLALDHRRKQPLRVQLEPQRPVVVSADLTGRCVVGVVRLVAGLELVGISIRVPGLKGQVHSGTVGEATVDGLQNFVLDLPPLPPEGADPGLRERWSVRAELADGSTTPLTFPSERAEVSLDTVGGSALALERTRRGNLGVIEWANGVCAIESARVTEDGVLEIGGALQGARSPSLRVQGMLGRTAAVQVSADGDGRFSARVPLVARRGRFGDLPLSTGTYYLEAVADEHGARPAVAVDRNLSSDLPLAFEHERLQGRLSRTGWGRLRVSLVTPRGESARSRAGQAALATWSANLVPERFEGLLLRSYFGESATDNGIGLVRELRRRGAELPIRWAVKDFSVPVPEGVEPVVHNSRDWFRLLRTSRYYMENMYQPQFHDKPAGQVLVQTFHGYPFKVMGHSHWRAAGFSAPLVRSYDRRTAEWDYLVSPAPYATPLLRREFGYTGEVLEIGYPRNDALLAADAGEGRRRVRDEFGIREDQTALLYAPTFRDYVAKDNHKAELLDLVGMDALAEELGEEFVVLNRSHAFNARSGERLGSRGNLLDVTDYPEVTDLYLAADAAVADYSSLRFDFGVTGKPMLFYVPDLERYREARGWLLDYESTAPGPLLSERSELVAQLRDLDGVQIAHRAQYERFRRDFLSLEDGRAGARLVDEVFVPRGDAPADR